MVQHEKERLRESSDVRVVVGNDADPAKRVVCMREKLQKYIEYKRASLARMQQHDRLSPLRKDDADSETVVCMKSTIRELEELIK